MRNLPYGFEIYLVNVKTMRTIAHIVVAFSEKLNFNFKMDEGTSMYVLRNLKRGEGGSEKTQKTNDYVIHG